MFTGIKKWLWRVRQADESQRRKVFFVLVAVIFMLVCAAWIVVLALGFEDFSARWISGTRTYTASGTETYNDKPISSLQSSWNITRDRIGGAWSQLMELLEKTPAIDQHSSSTPPSPDNAIFATSTTHSSTTP